jgi:hypothetical protein
MKWSAGVLRKLKYAFIALLFVVTAAEVMTFAYSLIAERKAERLTALLTTLKPGYTTMDNTKALFQDNGVEVTTLSNACGTPRGEPCDDLSPGAGNYKLVLLRRNPPLGFYLFPFPPFKRASFVVNLYFINGILDSINAAYKVGTTGVGYSRYAGEHDFRSSAWKYTDGGLVTSIGVASSGAAFDVPFPRFSFNYMYSVKCADARKLWPTAPPPTEEQHGQAGCR